MRLITDSIFLDYFTLKDRGNGHLVGTTFGLLQNVIGMQGLTGQILHITWVN